MAAKPKNMNTGSGAGKKSAGVIIGKINKDLSSRHRKGGGLNPLLMPEKIHGPNIKLHPHDILDMKSKKIIDTIDQSLTSLAAVNPIEEGGFGYDHPAVNTKGNKKKTLTGFPQAEATENIDEYHAILLDLKTIMGKLGAAREQIFVSTNKKN
jgi:hypothetical protein